MDLPDRSSAFRSSPAGRSLTTLALIIACALMYGLSWMVVARETRVNLFDPREHNALLMVALPFAWAALVLVPLSVGGRYARQAAISTVCAFAIVIGLLSLWHVVTPKSSDSGGDMAAFGVLIEAFVATATVTLVAPVSYVIVRVLDGASDSK